MSAAYIWPRVGVLEACSPHQADNLPLWRVGRENKTIERTREVKVREREDKEKGVSETDGKTDRHTIV